jgi:hypothetical protein
MSAIKILTRQLNKETSNLIALIIIGVSWVLLLKDYTSKDTIDILIIQLILTVAYTEYRVAVVKNDLVKKLGKDFSNVNPEQQQSAKILYFNLAYLIVFGVIVLGFVWYITHKYILTPLNLM